MALRLMKQAALAAVLGLGLAGGAMAAEGEVHLPDTKFSFEGVFGTYNRGELQRGFQIYKEVCSACHSMHLLSYRNLRDIGLTAADEVAGVAASVQIQDGPNDNGEMFERPGRASDRFRSPFANAASARAANNGALPPDLSVITKARAGGADYIHALLVGYEEPPAGVTVMEGMHYNKYFAGHQIAMAPPLTQDGQLTFADGTNATVDRMAHDVAAFLTWAAEPELESRRAMGVRVILFLAILGGITYAVKRKIWADVH